MQQVVKVPDIHVQGCGLSAVNPQRQLWNVGAESRESIVDLRRGIRLLHHVIGYDLEPGEIVAAISKFHLHLEAVSSAESLNWRRN